LFFQSLDSEDCANPNDWAQQHFIGSIKEPAGAWWFLEFKVTTTGHRSEIQFGGPLGVAPYNSFGSGYTAFVANDQVKLSFQDVNGLRVIFVEAVPEIAHVVRIEVFNDEPPTYRWFVDGAVVDEGLAPQAFPSHDASISWGGQSVNLPTLNKFDYIRYGSIDCVAVPALSHWAVATLALLMLTVGSMVFRTRRLSAHGASTPPTTHS